MYKDKKSSLIYSPSDLTVFMGSHYASWMERLKIEDDGFDIQADKEDELLSVLSAKGLIHEKNFLNQFKKDNLGIVDISLESKSNQCTATIEAMHKGVDIIYQASLQLVPFRGYADFLVKIPVKSSLGDYSYEVWDTKVAFNTKPYFIIQLCSYSEIIETIQGLRPENIIIALGNNQTEKFKTNDYFHYFQVLKKQFLSFQNEFNLNNYLDPAESSVHGRWSEYAEQQLIEKDHLSQIANISRSQIKKLEKQGIITCDELIETKITHIPKLNNEIFKQLKKQAKIQKESQGLDKPLYEIIKQDQNKKLGLALLPPHSQKDVFFDIEGYPLIDGGLEYLWGNTYYDTKGKRQFKDFWAHDSLQEKKSFKAFIDWVYQRWQDDSSMHIYHYANYEIAACRKLMGRYGVCEYEVDQLLRNEVFIDLYNIVKHGVLIGEPRYSIKNVEHLYRKRRDTEVGDGGASIVAYEQWRNEPDGEDWENSIILENIRNYNIDDCNSTLELVNWLRNEQEEHHIAYLGKTEVEENKLKEEISQTLDLRDRLLKQSEELRLGEPLQADIIENLAWMLEFHRRETKPVFWKLFDRLGMSHHELLDDIDCLACCTRTERPPYMIKRTLAYEFNFDKNQEFKQPRGTQFYVLGEEKVLVTLDKEHSDFKNGLLTIKSNQYEPDNIISLLPNEVINPSPIPQSIQKIAQEFEQNKGDHKAIFEFLTRSKPDITGVNLISIATEHNSKAKMQLIINAAVKLNNSYLTIQGPPGAGKTYTARHIIAHLVKEGKKIAVSSNSHKAINNLLLNAKKEMNDQGINNHMIYTETNKSPEMEAAGILNLKNPKLKEQVREGCVIGSTAWGFSREDLEKRFDYLFIDEAGQVSVANLLAMSRCCDNIIIMGDQMQLGQPIQGSHPKESGLSILDYLLHDQATIPDDMGIFLDTSYRMHSKINQFISETFYEGKLLSAIENDKQIIKVPEKYQGQLDQEAGIHFISVPHEGNTQASEEEVQAIKSLVEELQGREFTDKDGKEKIIGWDDMLFVAPYNHQVNQLQLALGDQAKVGSVDKFQGQQAPVVFLSMCTSDASESPRGIDFLFDTHRLNVAISRAQTLAIVVGNPDLGITMANSIEQMKLINVFSKVVLN